MSYLIDPSKYRETSVRTREAAQARVVTHVYWFECLSKHQMNIQSDGYLEDLFKIAYDTVNLSNFPVHMIVSDLGTILPNFDLCPAESWRLASVRNIVSSCGLFDRSIKGMIKFLLYYGYIECWSRFLMGDGEHFEAYIISYEMARLNLLKFICTHEFTL